MRKRSVMILVGLLFVMGFLAGCSEEECVAPDAELVTRDFVGSDSCNNAACHAADKTHADVYAMWEQSGHPYKLTKIDGAAPVDQFPSFSGYPNDSVDPPLGFDWSDITYTIGGYGWKMRWINSDGWIVTGQHENQYNFENQTWSDYHFTDPADTKPYDCGQCHTTGWVADEDYGDANDDGDLTDNQDGLVGMAGTFFAGGIHCEECHGGGKLHIEDPSTYPMNLDRSSELCGRCHTRDKLNRIAASKGFIQHHEQYDEWLHSPHAISSNSNSPGCNDCHDPHASVVYDDVALGMGMKVDCESCHADEAATGTHSPAVGAPPCVACHMPKAGKGAIAVHDSQGDVRTHLFAINPEPVGREEGMGILSDAGSLVLEDPATGQAKVTLDFACWGCHGDGEGGGGPQTPLNLAALSAVANGMHTDKSVVAANR
ncbi:hypothetical protein H8E07_07035 [bacterium]|nr:hypothetical protein [bacterium]